MPLRTNTITLTNEHDRLTQRAEDKADEQITYPIGSDAAQHAAQEGQRADRHRHGVAWAIEEWDTDEVSFGALTNGERHLVGLLVDENNEAADAMRQNVYIAVGTRDAPYLAHDPGKLTEPGERDAIKETAGRVAGVHPAFADWAESKIAELDRVDGDMGKSYRALVMERRRRQTSTESNG